MTEWEVGHDQDGPFIPVNIGETEVYAGRDDLLLYTFSPDYFELDHAYLIREEKRKKVGYYLFRLATHNFEQLANLMDENYFWHVKGYKPSEMDIKAYSKYSAESDERPEWLE